MLSEVESVDSSASPELGPLASNKVADKKDHAKLNVKLTESTDVSHERSLKEKRQVTEDIKETSEADQESGTRNRELSSLLQLSKEANLDTNITHKRNVFTPEQRDAKRSMRSQNPQFAAKQQNFLSKVAQGHVDNSSNTDETVDNDDSSSKKRKRDSSQEYLIGGAIDSNNKKLLKSAMELVKKNKDGFCWQCHRDGVGISCTTCPRSYHTRCLKTGTSTAEPWICPECSSILTAESVKTRSPALKNMPLGHLCKLLKFALKRMVQISDSEPFLSPVDEEEFPDYKTYIVQPMDFTKLEKNIKANLYGSTKAFEADAKWLLHNSIVFNSYQSKLTTVAKSIIKICKQEMAEIENCSTCYLNANTKKSWFVEVCPKPHLLVWAKLKGFPFWPAKVMCANNQRLVDVRFFGAHDRAWVSIKDCFLYSIKDPNVNHHKRDEINECIKEVDIYIKKLKSIYGRLHYPPYKTPYDPEHELEQLQMFLPDYKNDMKKDSQAITLTKPNQNKDEGSDEEDWEVRKYIEEGRINKSPRAVTPKQRMRSRKTPTHKKFTKTPLPEDLTPPKKTSRRSSIQSSQSDSSRISSSSDKNTKVDNVESENSKDSLVFDGRKNAEVMKEIPVLPSGKLKIADKLIKKLGGSDESENNRVIITSVQVSPEKSLIESESESEIDRPSLNDIKQVILGNTSLNNEKGVSKTKTEHTKSEKSITKDDDEMCELVTQMAEINNKEKIVVKSIEKPEIKSKEGGEIKSKEKKNNDISKPKEKMQPKKEKPILKSEKKLSTEVKLKKPVAPEHKQTETDKSEVRESSDNETSSVEDEESLLEPMYFEVVDEQNETPTETTKRTNATTKRKRSSSSITELDSPLQNKLVKLVDIDLIKNPKLYPLETPTPKPSDSLEKTKVVSPNSFDGLVEIKYEIESDDEQSMSDEYANSSTYSTHDKYPEKPIKQKERTKLKSNPVQKRSQNSLLKVQTPEKSIVPPTNNFGVSTTTAGNSAVTPKIVTTGFDSGGVMILGQSKTLTSDQVVLPPNQNITYAGPSPIFVQHPLSNYFIPTSTINVGAISIPTFTKPTQTEALTSVLKLSQNQVSSVAAITKLTQTTTGNTTNTQSISTSSKPVTTSNVTTVSKSQNLMMTSKQVQLSTSSMKQISPKATVTQVKPLSTSTKTTSTNSLTKLGINKKGSSPKMTTKQLPPLRKANQVTLPSQINLTSISNTPQTSVVITGNIAISTPNTTVPPPLCSLMSTAQVLDISTSSVNNSMNQANTSGQKLDSMDDYNFLTGHVPERLVKALSEITYKPPPPVLTPKPPGPLTANLDQGFPSSAGPISMKVNSIAHKLTDYFRGMIVDFLSEFSSQDTSEAAIAGLKLEIELLKQMHNVEVQEMKKNLQTILKEMHKNFSEERQRIIEETRKTCELEAIKRVDEAKSKQWCSNCMKEAQFYCCWNTSYCDYPCQTEHWPTHMERCTQNSDKNKQTKPDTVSTPKPHVVKKSPITKMIPGCNQQPKWVKKCFVPSCLNSNENSTKLFLVVPRDEERRRRWLETVCRQYVKTGCLYCCEDHFNLEEDAENWSFYKSKGSRIVIKKCAVPHLNLLQNNVDNSYSQLGILSAKFELQNNEDLH